MPNDWYTPHAKSVTMALAKAKSAPPDDAVPCTLVKMGDGALLLCADVSAAKAASLVKDAKSHGGKVVSAGSLYKGEEGLTFAVSEGSEAVKKQFSDAATTATGKALNVHIVAVTAPAAPPAPPPAAPPSDAAADFKARASRCAAAVKQATKEVQAMVQPSLVQALTLGKQGHYAEAAPFLQRVEDGLAAPAASTATPAAVPLAKAETAPNTEKALFTERLKAIRPRYVEAIGTNPPNKAVLEKAMGLAAQAVKDGTFAKGLKVLEGLEKALGEKPATTAAPAGNGKTTPVPPSDGTSRKFAADWETAVATVRGALSTLQAKLRQIGDPDLTLIANEGVTELLKQLPGGLDAALKAAETGGAEARTQTLPLLAKHRQFLQSDKLISEVDANPFGETPAVRETLTKALTALDQALAAP